MLKHNEALLSCRTRLETLAVVSTGAVALERVVDGFRRSTGSFLTDGFAPGMEITVAGFNKAYVGTLIDVTATRLTVDDVLTAQASGAGRTISVVLPATFFKTNVTGTPTVGRPYVEEDYLFGPAYQPGVGPGSHIIGEPQYVVRFYVASGVDSDAHTAYVGAVLALFPPHATMALASGQTLRVRSSPAPYAGQILPRDETGHWSWISVTIPLRAYTVNPS